MKSEVFNDADEIEKNKGRRTSMCFSPLLVLLALYNEFREPCNVLCTRQKEELS